jgi:hypothetical protein
MTAFSAFVRAVVLRYPGILYFEIGNEPDSAVDVDFEPYGFFGCWGDPAKPYYGGEDYARVFNTAKAAIMIRTRAKVLFGGLMLPCLDCPQASYFEGAVKTGTEYDGVAFHHYSWYVNGNESPQPDVDFLQEIMTRYNRVRPLYLTETSLLLPQAGEPYETAQGKYVYFIYNETRRLNLQNFIWFPLSDGGWYHSGLMEGLRLKPAFYNFENYDE